MFVVVVAATDLGVGGDINGLEYKRLRDLGLRADERDSWNRELQNGRRCEGGGLVLSEFPTLIGVRMKRARTVHGGWVFELMLHHCSMADRPLKQIDEELSHYTDNLNRYSLMRLFIYKTYYD